MDLPSYYLDIITYHSAYDKLGSSYQWNYSISSTIDNIDKGFDPNKNYHPFEKPEIISKRGKLTEQQNKAITSLLDYCDKEKLNALFIVAPYIITESDWLCLNTAGDIIQDRGYPFVNFNEYYDEIGLDFETDFGDRNHVNFLGAEKYTAYFSDYLDSHYDLPDHRGDKKYSNWDQDYESYLDLQTDWKVGIEEKKDDAQSARKVGKRLPETNDFETWYTMAQNKNFSLLIVKNSSFESDAKSFVFRSFATNVGMDLGQNYFAGIYSNGQQIYCTNEENTNEGNIGINGGLTQSSYSIEAGPEPSIIVDGVEYVDSTEGIHVVVFDNNYMEVYDSVTLMPGEKGEIDIIR